MQVLFLLDPFLFFDWETLVCGVITEVVVVALFVLALVFIGVSVAVMLVLYFSPEVV
jgi:hypothetical protein